MSMIPNEFWTRMGFDKYDLMDSQILLSAANKSALRLLGRTSIIALQMGDCLLVVDNLDKSDQFILGRDFFRNFDETINPKTKR